MMTTRFEGKAVLVTGGGSGIGQATAAAFAREGAAVTVAGRHAARLRDTVQLAHSEGHDVAMVEADVTDRGAMARLIDHVTARQGRLDVAVNNAGVLPAPAPVAEIGEDDWQQAIAVNLTGVLNAMQREIIAMRAGGGGVIVNMASTLGAHLRIPWMGAYVATKAAVSALTRNAAREYAGDGIRINAVSPGPIDTPMSLLPGETEAERAERLKTVLPAGRVGTVAEIAAAILWLASPEAAFVVGHDLVIDGGGAA